jgi:hypothetical protein
MHPHPNHKAYVCLKFRVIEGIPYFKCSGIYSAPASELTTCGDEIFAQILEVNGRSFYAANEKAKEILKASPWLRWIVPHLL